jgi:hypothetical protein
MHIEIEKSQDEIIFRLSGKLLEYINYWEFLIDKTIFEEQLSTGLFWGGEIDKDLLAIMRKVQEQGNIMPYYGVGGSRGVCNYSFTPNEKQCQLKVKHSVTNQVLELITSLEKTSGLATKIKPKFKYSLLPYFIPPETLPLEWQPEAPVKLDCLIANKEYQNLKMWGLWQDNEALRGNYEYIFGTVSLGTGFTVKVLNKTTGDSIDITNYDNW